MRLLLVLLVVIALVEAGCPTWKCSRAGARCDRWTECCSKSCREGVCAEHAGVVLLKQEKVKARSRTLSVMKQLSHLSFQLEHCKKYRNSTYHKVKKLNLENVRLVRILGAVRRKCKCSKPKIKSFQLPADPKKCNCGTKFCPPSVPTAVSLKHCSYDCPCKAAYGSQKYVTVRAKKGFFKCPPPGWRTTYLTSYVQARVARVLYQKAQSNQAIKRYQVDQCRKSKSRVQRALKKAEENNRRLRNEISVWMKCPCPSMVTIFKKKPAPVCNCRQPRSACQRVSTRKHTCPPKSSVCVPCGHPMAHRPVTGTPGPKPKCPQKCGARQRCQEVDVRCIKAPCPKLFRCVDIKPDFEKVNWDMHPDELDKLLGLEGL